MNFEIKKNHNLQHPDINFVCLPIRMYLHTSKSFTEVFKIQISKSKMKIRNVSVILFSYAVRDCRSLRVFNYVYIFFTHPRVVSDANFLIAVKLDSHIRNKIN